jgi:hypothetical protein
MASATVDEDMNFMTKMRKNRKDGRKRRTKGVGGRLSSSRESSLIYTVLHPETEQKAQAVAILAGRKGRAPELHVTIMMVSC